jgi:branched-chain amino acid transport system permease protein
MFLSSLFIDVLIGGLILGLIYSLLAAGLNLQYGVARMLNVAHGDFLMLGAYTTYFCFVLFGINPYVSLMISGPMFFMVGVLINMGIFQRMIRLSRSAEELEARSLLICFGLSYIIQNMATALWTANYRGYSAPLRETINILGTAFELNRILIAMISFAINLVLYLFLRFTKLGLAMRAAVDQPEGAQLVGVDIYRIYSVSFGLGLLLSAWTGTLISTIYSINPYMGGPYTMMALLMIILAGIGSFIGNIVAGLIVGFAVYITMRLIHSALTLVIIYAILVIVLLVRPRGLFRR